MHDPARLLSWTSESGIHILSRFGYYYTYTDVYDNNDEKICQDQDQSSMLKNNNPPNGSPSNTSHCWGNMHGLPRPCFGKVKVGASVSDYAHLRGKHVCARDPVRCGERHSVSNTCTHATVQFSMPGITKPSSETQRRRLRKRCPLEMPCVPSLPSRAADHLPQHGRRHGMYEHFLLHRTQTTMYTPGACAIPIPYLSLP